MRRNDTKTRIVMAAIDLFSEKGYTETGLRELAAKVGIKESSLYNHFASKQAILEYILDLFDRLVDRKAIRKTEVPAFIEQMTKPEEIIWKCFFHYEDDEYDFRKILKILFQEQLRNKSVGDYVIGKLFYQSEELFKYVLDTLVEMDKITPIDTAVYARMFISILMAYSLEEVHQVSNSGIGESGVSIDNVLEHLIHWTVTGSAKV